MKQAFSLLLVVFLPATLFAQTPSVPRPTGNPTTTAQGGIALWKEWSGHLSQSSGGQTMKMKDLQALLSNYGTPESDIAPHPEVTVYEGSPIDPSLGTNCRITYLMPLAKAESLLFRSRGIESGGRAVAPGFPDGLFIHTYDIKAGIYNHVSILTDSSQPQQQVVSIQFKAEGVNFYPPSPPFKKLDRDWHTHDYMNTENRGQPGMKIDTRVADQRAHGNYIIVNMTGGSAPDTLGSPLVLKPARSSPKESTTWYVPEPLIKLILYSLSKQLGNDNPINAPAK